MPQELKNKSKSIGTHARRELYWNGYTKMASKISGADGAAHCFLSYRVGTDGEGTVELTDLTKRQRGLVSGGTRFCRTEAQTTGRPHVLQVVPGLE